MCYIVAIDYTHYSRSMCMSYVLLLRLLHSIIPYRVWTGIIKAQWEYSRRDQVPPTFLFPLLSTACTHTFDAVKALRRRLTKYSFLLITDRAVAFLGPCIIGQPRNAWSPRPSTQLNPRQASFPHPTSHLAFCILQLRQHRTRVSFHPLFSPSPFPPLRFSGEASVADWFA